MSLQQETKTMWYEWTVKNTNHVTISSFHLSLFAFLCFLWSVLHALLKTHMQNGLFLMVTIGMMFPYHPRCQNKNSMEAHVTNRHAIQINLCTIHSISLSIDKLQAWQHTHTHTHRSPRVQNSCWILRSLCTEWAWGEISFPFFHFHSG